MSKSNSTKMNHKIKFYRKEQSPIRDELGQYPMVETYVCSAWASITPSGGSATASYAESIRVSTTHKITIRYRTGITADMWLTDDLGNRYEIVYVSNRYDKSDVLEILAVMSDG